ncbi:MULTISPECIES: hypothetical protein [unclassified Methylobacterium]|uniref:hypothetical protein n=1 Tax=unclassified Methylobacterium TaxID=2615210 RepID=UPI000CAB0D87|nr:MULTISPECIES: hypothetical protein [unclassified Methylobacterium]PIU06283.1 MAG: hypothetical protein COT56_10725 [Methylobacterium sp. CG09_land_8_20_14_0_10_71_15]PIU11166.1 MAG: hypothetical protein COT28_21370 [Methylobacterium sp. CG08_land_8_20_14_0_20_71_15]GBU19552.1 hypothetical protein AwMethylo_37670 [Methylobacterium sp.]
MRAPPPADADTFLATTELVAALDGGLAPLEAGLLAALHLGLAADSRSFARVFGVAHALVLRAVETLAGEELLAVTERDPRTQRTRYAPGLQGAPLLARLPRATA